MFKVNNKNTRTYFTPFSSVSIVDFEQLNISWVMDIKLKLYSFLVVTLILNIQEKLFDLISLPPARKI